MRKDVLHLYDRFEAEILLNPRFDPSSLALAKGAAFSPEEAQTAYQRISGWPQYEVTPLRALKHAAAKLDLAALYCKDESQRLGLPSFKALGACYAAVRVVSDLLADRLGHAVADKSLLAGAYLGQLQDTKLICATDGNHGFAVANVGKKMGCKVRIYIPTGVSPGREAALHAEGAEVVRVDGIYEDAVDQVHAAARSEADTHIITDYATPDYERVPALCMTGYSVMTTEFLRQLKGNIPTHFIVTAGCGGYAGAMITSVRQRLGDRSPRFVVVEPRAADCVFASAREGHRVRITGDLETIMGGLACAAVSSIAWPILDSGAFAFLRMNDQASIEAMQFFARPNGDDPKITAGETGAAAMGALLAICATPEARALLGIDRTSKILVVNCEGATDPQLYKEIVG